MKKSELRALILEVLNEEKKFNPISLDKLIRYALGITICCAGEYGQVYYNEEDAHVFIVLGDANPFDESMLKNEFIKRAIRKKDYDDEKRIKITIENERGPPSGEGWLMFNGKDKFVK